MAENTAVAKTEEKTEVAHSNNKVTDYSLGIFGTSDNFIMAMQMAKALASSTIVPATFQKNDANCLIAIEQAQRLRVSPLMVMQNLYVIQGRPSWSSKFLIAAINNSGKFDMELQLEMAKAEGWLGKNGSKWKTMPQLMLRYRAASFFSSLNCPELTMGLYTKEEMQDNDFKEYPMEDLQEQVKHEISENANTEDFPVDLEVAETVEEPKMADKPEKVETEVVDNDNDLPDFMK